jgi:hypothetical protein
VGLIDDFNRADSAGPTLGAGWGNDTFFEGGAGSGLYISSNQAAPLLNQRENHNFWTTAFAADQEAELLIGVRPGSNSYLWLTLRAQNPGTGIATGYGLLVQNKTSADDAWAIYRFDPLSVKVSPATNPLRETVNGASLRFRALGSDLIGQYLPPASSTWETIVTASDATYPGAGGAHIGLGVGGGDANTVARIDSFSGGVVTGPSASLLQRGMMMGVG